MPTPNANTLNSALAWRRWVALCAVATGALTLGIGIWEALPSTSGSLDSLVPALPLLVTVGLFGVWYSKNQDVIAAVHAEIASGNLGNPQGSGPDRAIARRIATIETPRARRQLARELRRQLDIARSSVSPDAGSHGGISVFTQDEQAALVAEGECLEDIADALEQSEVDARALVLLRRIAAGLPASAPDDTRAGERLRENLHNAWSLISATAPIPLADPGVR